VRRLFFSALALSVSLYGGVASAEIVYGVVDAEYSDESRTLFDLSPVSDGSFPFEWYGGLQTEWIDGGYQNSISTSPLFTQGEVDPVSYSYERHWYVNDVSYGSRHYEGSIRTENSEMSVDYYHENGVITSGYWYHEVNDPDTWSSEVHEATGGTGWGDTGLVDPDFTVTHTYYDAVSGDETITTGTLSSDGFMALANGIYPDKRYSIFDFENSFITYEGSDTPVSFADLLTSDDVSYFYFTGDRIDALGWTSTAQVTSVSISYSLAPVPEPESWAMLLAGLGVMGVVARRRKKIC